MSDAGPAGDDDYQPPIVLWDGECNFCRRWIEHWRDRVGRRVNVMPYQDVPDELLDEWDLDPVELGMAMHFVEEADEISRGAEAVVQLLRHADELRYQLAAFLYHRVPGVSDVAEGVYRVVADHRVGAARVTKFLWGEPHRQSFRMAQIFFVRLLAVAAFLAFWSMSRQVEGLLGVNGILPAAEFLDHVLQYANDQGWGAQTRAHQLPTLFWHDASDAALTGVCTAGMVLSAGLFVGLAPRLIIPALFVGYLSIVSVGQIFLGYQWDSLLLESLFVGVFVAPLAPWPGRDRRVPWAGRWLVWLLTFKLMFLSGYVKVKTDAAWTELEALDYHFWTQPIPNFAAWWVDKLPDFFKSVGVLFTLGAEFLAPLLIFAPRRLRHAGALAMIGLQLGIMATGTYGFFNVLTIALCVMLFDDRAFEWLTRGKWTHSPRPVSRWRVATGALTLLIVGTLVLRPVVHPILGDPLAPIAESVDEAVKPLRIFNSYGLFARMTKTRPEIIVQGSYDGEEWFTVDFEWKPTAVDEPLRMTTFHMPRLDWQMWFAALGRCQGNAWFHEFQRELLLGTDAVELLLEDYDVERPPPKYVRSRLYLYTFGEDQVWERRRTGNYCPVLELGENGELRVNPDRSLY